MKSLFFLISALLFFCNVNGQSLTNQTDSKGLRQGKWMVRYPDGKIRYEGSFRDNKPVGEWERYYENGKLKAVLFHRENTDRVKAELYDADGSLFSKGNFAGKDKDSTWTFYDNNTIMARESYRNGVKSGEAVSFSPEGRILKETPWLNGKIDGIVKEFYPAGAKSSETTFRQGKRQGECRIYFPNGQTQIEGTYANDVYDGEWTFYDEAGALKTKMMYRNGVLQNPEKYDSLQLQEFKALEQMRGKIKDPEQYRENPSELLRK